MPVQPALSATVSAINLDPPSKLATFLASELVQAARDGDPVVIQIEVTNHLGTPLPLDIEFYLLFGLVFDNDPPFVPSTDVPATYDVPTERAYWSGMIDATSTIHITMDATVSIPFEYLCRVFVRATIDSGDCFDISEDIVIHVMPPAPTDPRLIGVTPIDGDLWWYAPGIDEEFDFFTCTEDEFTTDLAMTSDGDIWVTGAPFYRTNLMTGAFEGYPHDFYDTLDLNLGSIVHAAGDPTNNTVIFLGSQTNAGKTEPAFRRYDALTGTVTPIPILDVGGVFDMIVDNAGRLVVARSFEPGLARFDLSSPGPPELLKNNQSLFLFELALDADGDYLAIGTNWQTQERVLVEIDSFSGAVTGLQSLALLLGSSWRDKDLVVAPNGDVYLSDDFGALAVFRSGGGVEFLIDQNTGGYPLIMAHLVYLDPSSLAQPADCDGNGRVDLTDWAHVQRCISGPIPGALLPGCSCADVNGNGTSDLRDLFAAQMMFAGAQQQQ